MHLLALLPALVFEGDGQVDHLACVGLPVSVARYLVDLQRGILQQRGMDRQAQTVVAPGAVVGDPLKVVCVD